ncbi:MAG: AraC family transcriptional regulator [Alphaproteobacteria bacterium]
MSVTQHEAVNSARIGASDRTDFWRAPQYGDMECLHATFVDHEFSTHFHETYSFGVICKGVELFKVDGQQNAAVAGDVIILNPGVLHDGKPGDTGFEYRMFYPSIELMTDIARDVFDRNVDMPFFSDVSANDPGLYSLAVQLHRALQQRESKLQADEALIATLARLIELHADCGGSIRAAGKETASMARAREMIEDRLGDDIGIDELAAAARLSRFHFMRSFRKAFGVPPHAYRTGKRIALAKACLASGEGIADVAVSCGFTDQSHFSRVFKNTVGVTPGQYRRSVCA